MQDMNLAICISKALDNAIRETYKEEQKVIDKIQPPKSSHYDTVSLTSPGCNTVFNNFDLAGATDEEKALLANAERIRSYRNLLSKILYEYNLNEIKKIPEVNALILPIFDSWQTTYQDVVKLLGPQFA